MDKQELVTLIGQYQRNLAQWENAQRDAERNLRGAKSNYIAGALALLIGLILIFVFWPLGVFIFLVGGLTFFTAIVRHYFANQSLNQAKRAVIDLRGKLAEMQAQLIIP